MIPSKTEEDDHFSYQDPIIEPKEDQTDDEDNDLRIKNLGPERELTKFSSSTLLLFFFISDDYVPSSASSLLPP